MSVGYRRSMEALGHEVDYFAGWQADPSFRARAGSETFWRGLCSDLTISDRPFDGAAAPLEFDKDDVAGAVARIRQDGYLATAPVLEPQICERLASAVLRIVDAGFHPLFLAVFDEFWRPFARLSNLIRPVLGSTPHLLGDFWVWCVSSRHAPRGWAMHRDVGARGTVAPDGVPSLITVWIPYTDATLENGCIRVVPTSRDRELAGGAPTSGDPVGAADASVVVGDVVALPAAAGAILAWNQHILHGGGPFTAAATRPRISAGIYFQSADRPSYGTPVAFDAPLAFPSRLRLIACALLRYQKMFRFPPPVLKFVGEHALPLQPFTSPP
jgi:hypothetical protein